ncbi:hypothetical protein DRE_01007 [Drechslerella stenobrocha 248]|uniref:Uncharacterized protein n=1 Tax=Drechslerella stenobrocha 248 TaxID=1043628 RepID=W7HYC4_9PEZI|nr:hypothetical protein DRE_01007 [Drechslerella stenobrocha 248]
MPSIKAFLKADEFQTMHPQAMESTISSMEHLLSLDTPFINLIISCFINTRHPRNSPPVPQRWTTLASQTSASSSPLNLLEGMLTHCIAEAWGNPHALPYAPLSLRKDIPLQKDLDSAVYSLERPATPGYQTAQEAYKRRMESVRRALDAARRCDADYRGVQAVVEQLATADWERWCLALATTLWSSADYPAAAMGAIDAVVAACMHDVRSWAGAVDSKSCSSNSSSSSMEEMHAGVPVLYARIAYRLVCGGVAVDCEKLRYPGSPFAVLGDYFEDVVVGKMEGYYYGATAAVSATRRETEGRREDEGGYLAVLAARSRQTTDWDSVYRGLRVEKATGMASI